MENKSPQVMTTYRTAYEYPVKCKTTEDVRTKLAEWLNFAMEYETTTGYKFSEQGRLEALRRFLPDDMSKQVDERVKWDKRTYADCISWVRDHVAEQHAYAVSSKLMQSTGSKGPAPMQVGALTEQPVDQQSTGADRREQRLGD